MISSFPLDQTAGRSLFGKTFFDPAVFNEVFGKILFDLIAGQAVLMRLNLHDHPDSVGSIHSCGYGKHEAETQQKGNQGILDCASCFPRLFFYDDLQ